MINKIRIRGFKSLSDVDISLPRLTVLYGPNAVGKSNVLDAVLMLKRLATLRTLGDAMDEMRSYPIEHFTFPPEGLPGLLRQDRAQFLLEADFTTPDNGAKGAPLRYRVSVETEPRSGRLNVADELLARLDRNGNVKGTPPLYKASKDALHVIRQGGGSRPVNEPVGLNHTVLSDPRRSAPNHLWIGRGREFFESVRSYYLDPRISMRASVPPREVDDIGMFGQDLAPFLYRLQNSEKHRQNFDAARRTVGALIPSVEDVSVELDERRGTLDLRINQNGVPFSSRMVSEGTLRVLGLVAIAVNPWRSSVVAFEEPENGVHLRRLELIAELLGNVAVKTQQQVIVTTHSPHFCERILKLKQQHPDEVGLLVVRQDEASSEIREFSTEGPLFEKSAIREVLANADEDGWFNAMVLRGLVDG